MTEGRRRLPAPTTDWLLNGLIGLVHGIEQEGVQMAVPVTLHVGGFLVSGYVISGREYFEEFSQIIQAGLPDAFGDENKESIAESFRRLSDQYQLEGVAPEEAVAQGRYRFVHLRNAMFLHPSGDPIPSNVGMLWRTKLETVDGFTLGMLIPQWGDEPEPGDESESDDELMPDE